MKAIQDRPMISLLTPQEVAGMLGISVRKVWRMTAEGELPRSVCVGKRGARWKREEIEEYILGLMPSSPPRTVYANRGGNQF